MSVATDTMKQRSRTKPQALSPRKLRVLALLERGFETPATIARMLSDEHHTVFRGDVAHDLQALKKRDLVVSINGRWRMVKTGVKMAGSQKGQRMARPRSEIDTSTYTGRVAARVVELMTKRQMSADELQTALRQHGVDASTASIYTWIGHTRDIPPDNYPAFAKALGLKSVRAFLPEE